VISCKAAILEKAFAHSHSALERNSDFKKFCQEHKAWLDDYSLFVALKEHFQGLPWHQWPDNIRARAPEEVQRMEQELNQAILKQKFFQYLFMQQWVLLKKYCKAKGVRIIGDLPIYVQHDSVDVWAHPSIFKLDEDGRVAFMAGVPPDYFSTTGQLWGNPVYNWEALKKTHYAWWKERLERNFSLFDIVRIDHFRGFVNFWQVPHGEETAINGTWEQGPGNDFFNKMLKAFKAFPIIAEDLGFLTEDVVEAIQKYKFPGMKILLFAFDSDDQNPYLPHNHIKNCIIYTGTHDNNTAKGWFQHEATEPIKQKMLEVLGEEPTLESVASQLVHLAMGSVANTAILPMQDILGLDETARMNVPGVAEGNWEWRLVSAQATSSLAGQIAKLVKETKRI
jgi:4-alpha-glucanotransferase